MSYEVPITNVNLAQQALLPGDLAAQSFDLGQKQLQAQRQTEQYEQQKTQQQALKDIFSRTDTTSPEGQADLIRQVGRVSPQMGMELQAQFQKGALTQADISKAKAQTTEAEAKTSQIKQDMATQKREQMTGFLGDANQALSNISQIIPDKSILPGTTTYKERMDRANKMVDEWSAEMKLKYRDTDIQGIIQKIDSHDWQTPEQFKGHLGLFQNLQANAKQAQANQEPQKTIPGPNGQPVINPAYAEFKRAEKTAEREPLSERVAVASATSQARAKASAGIFTPEEQDLLASLAEKGVNLPVGMRSQGQIKATLDGLMAKNPGKTPDQIADGIRSGKIELTALSQEARTAGTQVGRVQLATNEIEQFAPLALEASAKVPRGNFIPVNKLLKSYREGGVQDPNQKEFAVYVNSLLNAYDLLAARGGTDVAKREAAHKLLTTADSPEAFARGIKAFQREAAAARTAGEKAIAESSGREEKKETGVRKYNPETGGFD